MNWQPIETAPKDGRAIMVNDTQFPGEMNLAHWTNGEEWSGWVYTDELLADAIPLGPCPTHWIDIPPLPGK